MTDPIFLAWCAGFFDGEGSVGIYVRSRKHRVSKRELYELRVIVTQKDPAPLELFREAFGGYSRTSTSGCAKWCASSRVAERFLLAIRPYSVVKAEQIDVALAFQARRIPHGQGSARASRSQIELNRRRDPDDQRRLRELKVVNEREERLPV